jgi:hypothetical protein
LNYQLQRGAHCNKTKRPEQQVLASKFGQASLKRSEHYTASKMSGQGKRHELGLLRENRRQGETGQAFCLSFLAKSFGEMVQSRMHSHGIAGVFGPPVCWCYVLV